MENTFLLTHGKYGFGKQIIKKDGKNRQVVYITSDTDQAKMALKAFNENSDLYKDFDELYKMGLMPKTDFEPRLLIINNRYYTHHYLVKNISEVDNVAFFYAIENQDNLREWDEIEQVLTMDFINSCPDDSFKAELLRKYNSVENDNHRIKEHNTLVRNILNKINNSDKTDFYGLYCEYCEDFELIDFNKK